jgi:aspartyl-tRNA(Asn)/glutamyl-tRNA(Gln) amidotransferase subunit C
MIDELQEVDTSKIEPMFSPIEQTGIVYDDVISSDNLKEDFLTQAPNSDNNFFKVPKVVE